MGVHRKKFVFLKKRETVHNKKFIHKKKAGGYRIGFSQFSSIWKKQVGIKKFIHVHFKWVEKYYCFFTRRQAKKTTNHFSHFQYHIRRTQQKSPSFSKLVTGLSQQQPGINHIREYEKNIHETHIPTQRKLSEMMKMMVSWNRRRFWTHRVLC